MKNIVFYDAIDQTENSILVWMSITRKNQAYSPNNGDVNWLCIMYILNIVMSVCCPFCPIRRKVSLAKGKSISSYLGILYPAPKISSPNLNFKLCWRKILPLAPRNFFLLALTWIFLGIRDSRRFLWGIPIFFHWGLLDLSFLGELHLLSIIIIIIISPLSIIIIMSPPSLLWKTPSSFHPYPPFIDHPPP